MAYINVAEWSPDQVTDWLKGLDDSMNNYVHSFTNNEVGGEQLLKIRPYELEELGMCSIGHQEIILEAVEQLRNIHYNLDKENLQFLALHVATGAQNLFKQLSCYGDKTQIETRHLNDITRTVATIKPVISWLDRTPFQGQLQFSEIRKNMLRLGLEMATIAQRERFASNPVDRIRNIAERLAKLADYIIQDITDPMLLQPSTLNLITLRKRESELGFNIISSYHRVHTISDIKYISPSHNTGNIECGDEIVQVNYQTVVGWQCKTVISLLRQSPPDVLLTLKKRPKHTKIYGQIYVKPYRLPSKKRALSHRWGENVPSPGIKCLAIQDFSLPLKINDKNTLSDSDSSSTCSDIMTPTDTKPTDKKIHLFMPQQAVLQRRNTICGEELSSLRAAGKLPLWHERHTGQKGEASSPSLRDKSVSFGFGLELAPRPTTCLGITGSGKFNDLASLKNSLIEVSAEKLKAESSIINEHDAVLEEKSNHGISKVVRFDANMKQSDYPIDSKYVCNVEDTILQTTEPIPYVDEEDIERPIPSPKAEPLMSDAINNTLERSRQEVSIPSDIASDSTTNKPAIKRRMKLEKSHSTPPYGTDCTDETDVPPAIGPRKEFLYSPAPAPPPRPKKSSEIQADTTPPPPPPRTQAPQQPPQPPPQTMQGHLLNSGSQLEKQQKSAEMRPFTTYGNSGTVANVINTMKDAVAGEELELVTPVKTKNLTMKKKNNLLAKRRKVSLKALGTSDIQGHLYRRTRDKRGVTYWAKLYFVLIETVLYGFRNKDAQKANCMVVLPGFTVSLAKEVHSKPYSFKVYHLSKALYFAAESEEALSQWMEYIRKAIVHESLQNTTDIRGDQNMKEFFSETESSGDESGSSAKNIRTPSPVAGGQHTPISSRDDVIIKSNDSSPLNGGTATKSDKHFFKKFTKSSLPFKSSDKKANSDIPVPTPKFRSYRKAPDGKFRLTIGTNSNCKNGVATDASTYHSHIQDPNRSQTLTLHPRQDFKMSASDLEDHHKEFKSTSSANIKKMRKASPHNFIHASNPNLVDFDFHTFKTLDSSLPKINPSNTWDAHNNSTGCVTLKDLMLKKQEEEAQDMYSNRVLLGVEKYDERNSNGGQKKNRNTGTNNSGTQKFSKIQSRSLPKTPDYAMSFNPNDKDIIQTRSKEGLKLRDFGYEFIDEEETADGAGTGGHNHSEKDRSSLSLTSKKKSTGGSNSDLGDKGNSRSGSFKKSKSKFDAFKAPGEKFFHFRHANSDQYSTLPLNKKSSQFYAIQQIDQSGSGIHSSVNMKKSQTYFADFKDKKFEVPRKNSAPVPILAKFQFPGYKPAKEKKLLGSPRLHRTIFGRGSGSSTILPSACIDVDHEIFSPIVFTKTTSHHNTDRNCDGDLITNYQHQQQLTHSISLALPEKKTSTASVSPHMTPEYPNMECPPVFEPETYSLSDPNASLTLLRRRNNKPSK